MRTAAFVLGLALALAASANAGQVILAGGTTAIEDAYTHQPLGTATIKVFYDDVTGYGTAGDGYHYYDLRIGVTVPTLSGSRAAPQAFEMYMSSPDAGIRQLHPGGQKTGGLGQMPLLTAEQQAMDSHYLIGDPLGFELETLTVDTAENLDGIFGLFGDMPPSYVNLAHVVLRDDSLLYVRGVFVLNYDGEHSQILNIPIPMTLAIPEPCTIALLGAGLVGLLRRRGVA